jgi:hypothetical protein
VERAKGVGVGDRAWFAEDDRPDRGLALHARPARGHVNLSVWDGSVCRGTFRLPAADIPRLVDELTAALRAATGADPPADTGILRLVTENQERHPG